MAEKINGMIDMSEVPDPELDADWIKTPENRESEAAIHAEVARRHQEETEGENGGGNMASFTTASWSTPKSDLNTADYCKVCLIDYNEGEKIKAKCKLPVRKTPGGPYNKNALRNAAGRIFQMKGVPAAKKKSAARALVRLMRQAKIEVSSTSLLRLAGQRE